MSFPPSKLTGKKGRKNSQTKVEVPKVQLTSLIDIMTILLVFLLKSYSAEGEIFTPSKGLVLPQSTAKKSPEIDPEQLHDLGISVKRPA